MNSAFNIDCMEYMRDLPDNAFDLAVVDPPYGINVFRNDNASRSCLAAAKDYKAYAGGDTSAPDSEYFAQLKRISRNQIIFGANHFLNNIVAGIGWVSYPCWIVWDKENGQNDFADCELALATFQTAVRIFRFRWNGMLQGNMKEKEVRIHPTQKPVALYAWIFKNYAKPGMKILDTHLGSGSSRIAAYNAGLDFVGCEIDEDYYQMQEERFAKHIAQGRLEFDEPKQAEQINLLAED